MAGIAINISDISNEVSKVYNLRVSEHYGVGKVKPITNKDRIRIWLKRNEQILELLSDCRINPYDFKYSCKCSEIDLLAPSKINICQTL